MLWAGGSGTQCLASTKHFPVLRSVRPALRPPSLLFSAYQRFFTLPQLVKQLQHEADRSRLSTAAADNEGSYTSTLLMCLHSASSKASHLHLHLPSYDEEEKVKYRFGNSRITGV